MIRRFFNRIHEAEKRWSKSYGTDISTPRGRRQAVWHYHLADHGFLRVFWTNLFEIAPGVWRSNQPSARRLRRYREMGIRTILNLRGVDRYSFYLFEREAADRLGIEMIDIKIYARHLVPREQFMKLFSLFDRIERPFVLHCKSGADRAGLVSALWLLDQENRPVEEAQRQLHWRYAHLKGTRTGILDHLLQAYADDNAESPIGIRDWFATRYDPEALTRSFETAPRTGPNGPAAARRRAVTGPK
ncbi:fused DSP-PTPase phosphatase/NAD kinase-like protein [Frigidibacter sp. ROC022]|uniref:fused DSP-PTPase phosphatase/NAD kinase-like protein n=1 Tax=Frigidibacter sp. ROC022 TaxID=2971796 RepID=UPI00215B68E5|nr:tyrosine-protein phosphatase [Frigidibacter sp. ROC022]MCR8722959.1 tyrosine-protein phosphatase [Frigidibacter sp. ROC022]